MEEDIKILEEYLDKQDRKFVSEHRLMILQAVENLIAGYKKLEENKELKSDNYELNNRINDLLDLAKQKDKEIECLNIIHESYKEMVKENNYISKDKIKAKIEELENQKRQWIEDRDNKHKDSEIIYAIEVLQSLLEKE